MKKNKKASVSLYLAFMIAAIVIVFIAAVMAPFGVLFNTEMYVAAEQIMSMANDSISNIQNDTVRMAVQSSLNAGMAAQQNNIQINADIFQYSWIFIIILIGLVVFLFTRRITEVQGGGGFV